MKNQKKNFGEELSNGIISRNFIIIFLLILQIVLLGISFFILVEYIHYIYMFNFIISLFIVVHIMNRQESPEFKIVWLVFMCLLPIFGIAYYLFIELNPKLKRIERNIEKILGETAYLLDKNPTVRDRVEKTAPNYMGIINFLQNQGPYPVYNQTDLVYYKYGEIAFEDIKIALKKAKKFIFIEYFIISPGKLFDEIFQILKEKAEAGVEIRLMYDGFSYAKSLSHNFPEQMREYGIKVSVIEPFSPFLSSDQIYRDHRKITVVDGEVGFTGGFNIADEYVNLVNPFGKWKDVGVKISGEAVRAYTILFLQNWHLDGLKEKDVWENYLKTEYLNEENSEKIIEEGFIIPYADSPNVSKQLGQQVYIDILNLAKDYVWIMTPYLILGNDIMNALKHAAYRGVDVKIIIPHIPDKKIPFLIAKSYYPEMINAGIKIYEYIPGFVHAKLFVSDNRVATIGSYNLDYRSFYLNYEVGALLLDCPALKDIIEDYNNTMEESMEMNIADYDALTLMSKIMGKTLRMFGTLM